MSVERTHWPPGADVSVVDTAAPFTTGSLSKEQGMGKNHETRKEEKKKPRQSLKERRKAKKGKREEGPAEGIHVK